MSGPRFEGRSIIVTGGGSGIGEATARAFAAEGGRVTIAELNEERGRSIAWSSARLRSPDLPSM